MINSISMRITPSLNGNSYMAKLNYVRSSVLLAEEFTHPSHNKTHNNKKFISLTPQQRKETLAMLNQINFEDLPHSVSGEDGTRYTMSIEHDEGQQKCEWWQEGGDAYLKVAAFKAMVLGLFGMQYQSL